MITEGEIVMKITQLIGLEEEARKVYRCLERDKLVEGNLSDSYIHHQASLELLIKYQKSLNGNSR